MEQESRKKKKRSAHLISPSILRRRVNEIRREMLPDNGKRLRTVRVSPEFHARLERKLMELLKAAMHLNGSRSTLTPAVLELMEVK